MAAPDAPAAATPPHSMEAEQSLLGALLMDNAALADVAALVDAGDFYHPEHRTIFSGIVHATGSIADHADFASAPPAALAAGIAGVFHALAGLLAVAIAMAVWAWKIEDRRKMKGN